MGLNKLLTSIPLAIILTLLGLKIFDEPGKKLSGSFIFIIFVVSMGLSLIVTNIVSSLRKPKPDNKPDKK